MAKVFKPGNVNINNDNIYIVEAKPPIYVSQPQKANESGNEKSSAVLREPPEDILSAAQAEAEAIIGQAKKNAEFIMADVRQQADKIREENIAAAQEEGFKKGYGDGVKSAEELMKTAEGELAKAQAVRENALKELEGELIGLVLGISKKLLGDSVQINRQVVLNLIKMGLSDTTAVGDITIRVSAGDYELVVKNKEDIVQNASSGSKVEIMKDASLEPGGCIIETPFGNIDCGIGEQFEALKQSFHYICEHDSGE